MRTNPTITTERPKVNPVMLLIAHGMIWGAVTTGLYRFFFVTRPMKVSNLEQFGIPLVLASMTIFGINLYIRATRKRDQYDVLSKLQKEEKEITVQTLFKAPLVISDRSADFVVVYQFLLSTDQEVIKVHPSFEETFAQERITSGSKIKGVFATIDNRLELLDRLVVVERQPVPAHTGVEESVLEGNVVRGKGFVREKFAAEALPRLVRRTDGIEYWYQNKAIPRSSSKAFKEDFSNKQRIELTSAGLELDIVRTKGKKPLLCVLQVNDDFVTVDWETFASVHQGDYVDYEMNYYNEKAWVTKAGGL